MEFFCYLLFVLLGFFFLLVILFCLFLFFFSLFVCLSGQEFLISWYYFVVDVNMYSIRWDSDESTQFMYMEIILSSVCFTVSDYIRGPFVRQRNRHVLQSTPTCSSRQVVTETQG